MIKTILHRMSVPWDLLEGMSQSTDVISWLGTSSEKSSSREKEWAVPTDVSFMGAELVFTNVLG